MAAILLMRRAARRSPATGRRAARETGSAPDRQRPLQPGPHELRAHLELEHHLRTKDQKILGRSFKLARTNNEIGKALLIVVVMWQGGCAASDQPKQRTSDSIPDKVADVNNKLSLAVEVAPFQPRSIHDDFLGGSPRSYDVTVLTVVEPGIHQGAQLRVVQLSGDASDPKWVSEGRRCRLSIEPWLLDDSKILIPRESVSMKCEGDRS